MSSSIRGTRTKQEWCELGYHHMIAAALEGNEKTLYNAIHLSNVELIDLALQWEGIIGYTANIISLVKEPKR